jgi:hypothetical protein
VREFELNRPVDPVVMVSSGDGVEPEAVFSLATWVIIALGVYMYVGVVNAVGVSLIAAGHLIVKIV